MCSITNVTEILSNTECLKDLHWGNYLLFMNNFQGSDLLFFTLLIGKECI